MMKITVLIENSAIDSSFKTEHGISFWIETETGKVIFDAGQSEKVKFNIEKLKIPVESANALVISHGHYDHTGAVKYILSTNPNIKIYLHPQALEPKYGCKFGFSRYIGISEENKSAILEKKENIIYTESPTKIIDRIYVTGPIPRIIDFEQVDKLLYKDRRCKEHDEVIDDQAIYIETDKGIVVLLGCAHSGPVNTVEYIRKLKAQKIYAVIGGTHLMSADKTRIEKTIEYFESIDIKIFAPCHCTGASAIDIIKSSLPEKFSQCATGMTFEF